MPSLKGKVSIVTGGNIGLGYQSALELAKAGSRVVIACRDEQKAKQAIIKIVEICPKAKVSMIPLDLTNLSSIESFASLFSDQYDRLDILLNNAAVVNLSTLQHTELGHEMHFATNHLGHFALTGNLLPMIRSTANSRVVTISSGGHKFGTIDFGDLEWKARTYHRVKAYGDSKLANLLFCYQLQREFDKYQIDALSLAAHPGLTGTERQQNIGVGGLLSKWIASNVVHGVRSQLRACYDPNVKGGEYFGPKFGIRGKPTNIAPSKAAQSIVLAKKLWRYSTEVTGVNYEFE